MRTLPTCVVLLSASTGERWNEVLTKFHVCKKGAREQKQTNSLLHTVNVYSIDNTGNCFIG